MTEEPEGFEFACLVSDLKEKVGQRFYLNDVDIAIFKVNNKIFAVSNVCPHQHTAQIYEGYIEEECVFCPVHGWMFNLDDGKLFSGSKGLDVYETKIINDKIYVKAEDKKWNW